MYIKRNCEKMILEVSQSFSCIVVYGPRQVGKSTTIDYLFGDKYQKDRDKENSSPKNPTKNFRVLKKYNMNIQKGLIIDTCDRIRPVNEEAYYYPVSILGM